jgi:hypothetical protein
MGGAAAAYISLVLLGIMTGILSMMLGASVYGMGMFWGYFASPAVVLLNILPPVVLMLLMYFATSRASVAFAVPALALLALSCADYFKVQIRGEPLSPGDLAVIAEAGDVLSGFRLRFGGRMYLAAAFFSGGTVYALLLRHRPGGASRRVVGTAAAAAVGLALYAGLYTSSAIYDNAAPPRESAAGTVNYAYISRGFLYPFIHHLKELFTVVPPGYSAARARGIEEMYDYDDIPPGKKVNVISIMLEAYCDLSEYGAIEFTRDVYEKWHALQRESVHGHLITNIFGGGTKDTERLFLTGDLYIEPYDKPARSHLDYFKQQMYYIEGFHAGDGWYYERASVYPNLGFDNYYFLEDFANPTRWDSFFFPMIKSLYDKRDKTVPYFAHNLTYQNHGGYSDEQTGDEHLLNPGGFTEPTFNILNNYLTGIYDTNERLWAFIETLRGDPAPVVVLLYGDHKPSLGDMDGAYSELGIDMRDWSADGFYNMYSTPYIIWANGAARSALGDFTGDGGDFSPCFLMNRLFDLCGWAGDQYIKAMGELFRSVDVFSTATGFFREDGELVKKLSHGAERFFSDVRILDYYRTLEKRRAALESMSASLPP